MSRRFSTTWLKVSFLASTGASLFPRDVYLETKMVGHVDFQRTVLCRLNGDGFVEKANGIARGRLPHHHVVNGRVDWVIGD